MKFETFELSFAVSVLLIGYLFISGMADAVQAAMLFSLSQIGYFALFELKKSGFSSPLAEVLFASVAFACYFLSALALSMFSAVFSLAYVPLVFCIPAAVSATQHYLSG